MSALSIAAILGVLTGAASYVYEKTFIVLLVLGIPAAFMAFKYPNPVPGFYKLTLSRGNGTENFIEKIFMTTNNPVQDAAIMFPLFFIAARLVAWMYMRLRPTEKKVTRRQVISKRNSIYKEHRMKPLYEPKK